MESIGQYAFYECADLTSVTIPNSVTSIGDYAFSECSGLTSVHISDIAAWCNIDFESYSSNPLNYAYHLYLKGEEVKDLIIPNNMKSIGNYAFRGCSGLTSVTIPNSVTSIGESAFSFCSSLTSVTIGNSVKSIGAWAFYDCLELKDIYCYADNVPAAYSYPYSNLDNICYAFASSIANATLHVPAASIDSYRATEPWNWFGRIVALTE